MAALQALSWTGESTESARDTFAFHSDPTPASGTKLAAGLPNRRRRPMRWQPLLGALAALCGAIGLVVWLLLPKSQPPSSLAASGPPSAARPSSVASRTGPAVTASLASAPAFLADLPEVDVKVGYGQFGKKGYLGYANRSFTVKGAPSPNGLSMHPPRDGSARVVYALGKKYRTFTATAAITDDGNSRSPLTFRVLADSKEIWKSRPLRQQGDTDSCSVGIGGVDRLELEVHCAGKNDNAHAVWLEPEVRP